MQRTALRAAADAERYAKQLTLLQNIMTSLNKTYLLTFYLLLFIIQFPSYLNSTSQSPDTLFFNGRKYALYGHPLDILIEKDASFAHSG
jgi:hypothetical protein